LDERKRFIEKWHKRNNDSFADLCRQFGVARKTGYKWIERFKRGGWPELKDVSRAPQNSPQAVAEDQAEEIVGFRQQHPSWGARKIREYFQREKPGQQWPAASTIHALLHSQGLIADRKRRRKTPPYTQPLQHVEAPNQVWCADFKGWFRCGDGVRCDPLTITDAHSRYLLRCRAVSKADGEHVRAIFEAVFRQYGVPEAIRTDNGPPFASPAPGGLSRLSMWWWQLGIRHERIDPGRPEQNGRHERMHRTLKAETANPPRANLRQQQRAFHRFEQEYNQVRPHQALDYRTPSQVYVASAREYPRRLPELEYPAGVHLRRISQQGSLKWKTERTFISEVLARQTVGLLEVDDELYEVYYGPVLLGWFEAAAHLFVVEKRRPKGRRPCPAELTPATA
jgi:transposase InsO family protein